jgi:two-component system, cell cycle response regulator
MGGAKDETPARVRAVQWNAKDENTPLIEMDVNPSPRRRGCLVVLAGPRVGEVFAREDAPDGFLIGRDAAAHLRLVDEGVSRLHARIVLGSDGASLVDLDSTNGTWVSGKQVKQHRLVDGEKIRVGQTTAIRFCFYDDLEEECQRQLLEAALCDGLTRAFNRRYFLERLASETAYADRHHKPVALLLIDLDYFKLVNDTWGHVVGDRVLKKVADALQGSIRADDVLARYGGEEFVVLARDTALDGGVRFAERLRVMIADTQFEQQKGRPIEVRVSIGVAAFPDPAIPDAISLIENADKALYRAKRAGRNRVDG